MFTAHFQSNKKSRILMPSSLSCRRMENLFEAMSHFKIAMLEVCDLDHSVVISILKKGSKANSLYSLLKKNFHDFAELFVRASKYINAKEGMVEKRKEKVERKRA